MPWNVSILPAAVRQLAKLDRPIRKRIDTAIDGLTKKPRPPGCKKLVGVDAWRVRVGDWRIIYQIRDDRLIVLILRVGHRREVYD